MRFYELEAETGLLTVMTALVDHHGLILEQNDQQWSSGCRLRIPKLDFLDVRSERVYVIGRGKQALIGCCGLLSRAGRAYVDGEVRDAASQQILLLASQAIW